MLEIFFIICLEIALLASAFLYIYNSVKQGILNDSPAIRRERLKELEAKTDSNETSPTGSPSSIKDDPQATNA